MLTEEEFTLKKKYQDKINAVFSPSPPSASQKQHLNKYQLFTKSHVSEKSFFTKTNNIKKKKSMKI